MIDSSFLSSLLLAIITQTVILGIVLLARRYILQNASYPLVEVLWVVFIFYLFIPIFPNNPVSMKNIISQFEQKALDTRELIDEADKNAIQTLNDTEPVFIYEKRQNYGGVLVIYLICSLIFLFVYFYRIHRYHRKLINTFLPPDEHLNYMLCTLAGENTNRENIRIVITSENSPFVLGIRNSTIAIPKQLLELDDQQMTCIIAHELTHVRRHDNVKLYLLSIIRILLFFNPVIHFISFYYKKDIELICDYYTLRRLRNRATAAQYMRTILEVLIRSSYSYINLSDDCTFVQAKNSKARLEYISSLPQDSDLSFFKICVFIIACFMVFSGKSNNLAVAEILGYYFFDNQITGGIISCVGRAGSDNIYTNNPDMIEIPQKSLSTIKVPITYYVIHADMAHSEDTMTWDHTHYEYPVWEMDQTLSTALKYSVTWYYGNMLDRIANGPLNTYLIHCGYKDVNQKLNEIDDYLVKTKISPLKQMEFMRGLSENTLTDPSSLELLNMMYIADVQNYKIYGKTGTGTDRTGKQTTGWFIGAAVSNGERIYFSYYSDMYSGSMLKKAVLGSFRSENSIRNLINLKI